MAFFLPPVIAAGSTILAGVGGVAAYVQSKMNELDKKIATMAKATRDIERSAELATTGGNIWSELLKPFASEIGPGLKTAGNAICALAVGTLLIGVYALFEARDPSLGPHVFSRVIVPPPPQRQLRLVRRHLADRNRAEELRQRRLEDDERARKGEPDAGGASTK